MSLNFRIASVILAMLAMLMPAALAVAVTDTVSVAVTVSSSAEITVLPSSFSATTASIRADTSATNFVIKNTGTTNVTNTFAYVSTITDEATNPLGTGQAAKYAAGGFIMLSPNTSTHQQHIGRLEWNLTSIPASMNCGLSSATIWGCGWYRNATAGGDFLWSVRNATGTLLDTTTAANSKLIVSSASEANINTGTSLNRTLGDSIAEAEFSGTQVDAVNGYVIFEPTSGPLNGYCVAAKSDATKIFIYEFDQRTTPNFAVCGSDSFVRSSALPPGEEQIFNLVASVPAGVPSDAATTSSTLTISGTG